MKRSAVVATMLAVLTSSCVFSGSPRGAADDLAEMATRVEKATYTAVYQFAFTRQPLGEADKLEITQLPPTTVRQIQQSTKAADGKTVSLHSWYATRADGNFACTDYVTIGVRCMKDPIARTTFGSAKLDEYFDAPRHSDSFASVRKIARSDRIANQRATCFETAPRIASEPPGSPLPTEGRYRYELCYAADGILLRGRRATLDEGTQGQADTVLEAVSVSRVVAPSELKLPGPVVAAGDINRAP